MADNARSVGLAIRYHHGFHFIFVPLTIGLALLLAIMQTASYRTRHDEEKHHKWEGMTVFWRRLFLINFAIGVVTGIVQEFQSGMNWSAYSRYVGSVFGAPLAIEALPAFFLESAISDGHLPGYMVAVLPLVALGAFEVVTPVADAGQGWTGGPRCQTAVCVM